MNVVFAIGCKRYRDPDVARLQYADRDAKSFVETVLGTQDPDNIEKYLLHDEHENEDFRPTRANILYFLSRGERRDKSNELDFLFFYFSGHGWSSKDGTDYLLTSDSLVNMPEYTAISVPMLEGHLRNWEAKHAVLFIDACRTVRTGGKSITILDESRIDVDSLCPPGMVTFCSCEPGQTSYEADPIHSGVFTEAVCKALSDEGRCSTIEEMDKYLVDKVPRISDTYGLPRQTPYSRVEPLAVRKALIVSQRTREAWQIQKRRKRLNELYAQARSMYENRDWQAVIDIFEQIRVEDPSYSDPEALLVLARKALEAQDLGQRVAAVYAEGRRHLDAGEWQQALERFEEAHGLQPGYRDTEELLSRVWQELAPPSTVEVPDLSGREVSQASSTLARTGLKLGARSEASSETVSKGRIIEQSPEAGAEIEAGSLVSVTVSSGPLSVEVPDLAGKSRTEARTMLYAAGLKLGSEDEASSDEVPEGKVLRQHPAASTKVKPDTSVNITISTEHEKVTIPDVSAKSVEEARQILLGAGLDVASTRTRRNRKSAGAVISTDPPAGSPTAVGSSVIPIVSSGPRAFPWTMATALVAAVVVAGISISFMIAIWGGGGGEPGVGAGGSSPSATIVSDLPLQGANRAQTMSMVNAIKLAIEERNGKAGNVKIEYESLDDATAQSGQWDAAKCAENAQQAAQDKDIIGWIGPFNSGCAAVEIPILNEASLGMISPANTYIGLTKPGGEPDEPEKYYPTGERNYARVIVADEKQGKAGAKLMQDEGFKSVYILDDKETYGKGLADQVQQTAEKLGIEVVGREGIDGSASNYRSLMNKIAQEDPDAIYFGGISENNAGQVIKDKVGAGMSNDEVAFIGPEGIFVDELLSQAGDSAEGIYVTFGGLPESELSPEGHKFVKTFEQKYDEEIQPYTPYAYEAANVMLDAIERASKESGGGVPDREAVVEQIFATKNYKGVLGTWSFDKDGDTTLTKFSVDRVENGEFVLDRVIDVDKLQ